MIRQVTLNRATRKADKTVSIQFVTDLEETSEGFMEIDKLLQSRGILYYSDRGELTQTEIDEIDSCDVEIEGKSKSQRLRSVLYVLWQQFPDKDENGVSKKDFSHFYSNIMEVIIQHYKDKLD